MANEKKLLICLSWSEKPTHYTQTTCTHYDDSNEHKDSEAL